MFYCLLCAGTQQTNLLSLRTNCRPAFPSAKSSLQPATLQTSPNLQSSPRRPSVPLPPKASRFCQSLELPEVSREYSRRHGNKRPALHGGRGCGRWIAMVFPPAPWSPGAWGTSWSTLPARVERPGWLEEAEGARRAAGERGKCAPQRGAARGPSKRGGGSAWAPSSCPRRRRGAAARLLVRVLLRRGPAAASFQPPALARLSRARKEPAAAGCLAGCPYFELSSGARASASLWDVV